MLDRFAREGKQDITLGSLCGDRLPYLHPDLPLETALRFGHTSELIPVVSRADFGKLEGVISYAAVLSKYKMSSAEEAPLS
jgi:hypothetical protein